MTELVAGVGGTVDYYPLIDRAPYDPVDNGGSITDLRLYSDPGRTVLLTTVVGAVKVATAHYRFTVGAAGAPAPGHVYAIVRWVPKTGASTTTDANDVIPVYAFGGSTNAGIVTTAEVKAHLNDLNMTAPVEAELVLFVEAAGEVVEELCGAVVPRTVTEVKPAPSGAFILDHHNVVSVTSVEEGYGATVTALTAGTFGAAAPASGYRLSGSLIYRTSGGVDVAFSRGHEVRVVYVAGLDPIPAKVRLATLELIKFWWNPSQLGLVGEAGPLRASSATPGTIVAAGYLVPHAVVSMLGRYVRPPGMVA